MKERHQKIILPFDLIDIERELCKRKLNIFAKKAWHIVEPGRTYVHGWHIDAICEHLESVSRGQIRNLLINIPPRHMKSLLVSVFWPVWEWTFAPHTRWLFSSYAQVLSRRDSVKCRRLIQSQWFQQRFGNVFTLTDDQNEKLRFENDKTGYRISTSVGGAGTGEGGDFVVCLFPYTRLTTNKGNLSISEIVKHRLNVSILSYDHNLETVVWRPIEAFELALGRESVRVEFSNNAVLEMTTDHPVYVIKRGYIRADLLSFGDEVLTNDSSMFDMREAGSASTGALCAKQERDILQSCLPRKMANWVQQSSMVWRSCQAKVFRVWTCLFNKTITRKARKRALLFQEMSGRTLQKISHKGLYLFRYMQTLWKAVSNLCDKNWKAQFLFEELCKPGTQSLHKGRAQRAFCAWQKLRALPSRISGRFKANKNTRSKQVSIVWNDERTARQGIGRTPRRLQQGQQRSVQSNFALSLVSRIYAWWDKKSSKTSKAFVTSIRRITPSDFVYNVRIKETHNYFAEGILVHNCDDPHKVGEAESKTVREGVLEWWDEEMSSRGNDPKTFAKVIVMQRIHEKDLSGHVLAQGGYEHLCLPAEYEGSKKVTSIGWADPRTKAGDLLWPERFGEPEIKEMKLRLGSYGTAGQLQQRPSPGDGGELKREWWKYWKTLPSRVDQWLISADLTFGDSDDSDFVVFQAWARVKADKFLVDQIRGRMNFPTQLQTFNAFCSKHAHITEKVIEEKANGAALIATVKHEIAGVVSYNPKTSKENRVRSISPIVESGNVYLPDPAIASWVNDFVEECAAFPKGANDDQIDTAVQALLRFETGAGEWTTNMTNNQNAVTIAGSYNNEANSW